MNNRERLILPTRLRQLREQRSSVHYDLLHAKFLELFDGANLHTNDIIINYHGVVGIFYQDDGSILRTVSKSNTMERFATWHTFIEPGNMEPTNAFYWHGKTLRGGDVSYYLIETPKRKPEVFFEFPLQGNRTRINFKLPAFYDKLTLQQKELIKEAFGVAL